MVLSETMATNKLYNIYTSIYIYVLFTKCQYRLYLWHIMICIHSYFPFKSANPIISGEGFWYQITIHHLYYSQTTILDTICFEYFKLATIVFFIQCFLNILSASFLPSIVQKNIRLSIEVCFRLTGLNSEWPL